mmetsp:Transcript_62463/g.182578  ORF Transcript_62463/g.182578 Transcript_62463/m.182578 type:complete len:380 (+) Transcript_62463:668-1807(+)
MHLLQLAQEVVGEERLLLEALGVAHVDREVAGERLVHRDLEHAQPVERAGGVPRLVGPRAAGHQPDLVRAAAVDDVGRHGEVRVRHGVKGPPEDGHPALGPGVPPVVEVVEAVAPDVGQDRPRQQALDHVQGAPAHGVPHGRAAALPDLGGGEVALDEGGALWHHEPGQPRPELLQAAGVIRRGLDTIARPLDDKEGKLLEHPVPRDDGLLLLRISRLPVPVPGRPVTHVGARLQPVGSNDECKVHFRMLVPQPTQQVVGVECLGGKALYVDNLDRKPLRERGVHCHLAHAVPVHGGRLQLRLVRPRAAGHQPHLVRTAAVHHLGRAREVRVRDRVEGTPVDRHAPADRQARDAVEAARRRRHAADEARGALEEDPGPQ